MAQGYKHSVVINDKTYTRNSKTKNYQFAVCGVVRFPKTDESQKWQVIGWRGSRMLADRLANSKSAQSSITHPGLTFWKHVVVLPVGSVVKIYDGKVFPVQADPPVEIREPVALPDPVELLKAMAEKWRLSTLPTSEITEASFVEAGLGVFKQQSSSRRVWLGQDLVLKMGGAHQSLKEAAQWVRMSIEDSPNRKYFAPVLAVAPDGSWLIQKRIHSVDEEFRKALKDEHVTDIYWSTGHPNYVVSAEGPIVVDYGY